jgi:hypothetical protein
MRPHCLADLERYDAGNGTAFASEASEMFLRIAACAALEKGSMPEMKQRLLAQLAVACAERR